MKPAPFEYDAPSTLDEALAILAEHGDDSKVLAGGQSLVPLMNFRLARPARIVDLNGIGSLSHIERRNGSVLIGAMTRHSELEQSETIAAGWPVLTEAVGWVGHQQIRNRGTAGGSVAHADPAAELPAVLAALDASFHIKSRDRSRTLGWRDFFVAELTTALEPDEILVDVEVPALPERCGTGFVEFARRHGDFALGGAAAVISLDGSGRCQTVRLSLLAAAPTPVRALAAEEALTGSVPDEAAIGSAVEASMRGLSPTGDIHGSTEYRLKLLAAMSRRALRLAAERARSAR